MQEFPFHYVNVKSANLTPNTRNNMNTTQKSNFDTGHWSEVNGLPGQDDIINYLEHLLSVNPNQCFTRRGLMDSVINEFGIPASNAEAEGPKSNTAGFYTRMTYLITDAIQGKRRADGNQFAKRICFGVYQHVTGNGVISPKLKTPKRVSVRLVNQAMVSVKILRDLNHSPEQIICETSHLWEDDVIEAAIEKVFHLT